MRKKKVHFKYSYGKKLFEYLVVKIPVKGVKDGVDLSVRGWKRGDGIDGKAGLQCATDGLSSPFETDKTAIYNGRR